MLIYGVPLGSVFEHGDQVLTIQGARLTKDRHIATAFDECGAAAEEHDRNLIEIWSVWRKSDGKHPLGEYGCLY